jgi:hypothetical protein
MATTLRQQVSTLKFIVMVLSIGLMICVLYNYQIRESTSESQKKDDKVCLKLSDYNKLLQSPTQHQQTTLSASDAPINRASDRDIRVLKDPLFPALNRSETDTHNRTIDAINRKQLYTRTQDFTDRYRMVAYVTNQDDKKDSGGNVWKLMGRNKDRNQAEFYLIPANNNYDMKVMLNNDVIAGNEKLRDIYTIPKTLSFKSPLLNDTPYEVTELPMTDMTDLYN